MLLLKTTCFKNKRFEVFTKTAKKKLNFIQFFKIEKILVNYVKIYEK